MFLSLKVVDKCCYHLKKLFFPEMLALPFFHPDQLQSMLFLRTRYVVVCQTSNFNDQRKKQTFKHNKRIFVLSETSYNVKIQGT